MWIRFIRTFVLLMMFFLSASCQIDAPEQHLDAQKVGFYAGGVSTRTEMLPNGLSASWESGDKIAVWAINSSGEYILDNQVFETYGLDFERGFFTSTLDSPMQNDTYNYYCSYPLPVSVNGTEAVFNIPALQDGKVRGGADIMIATPVTGGALTPIPDPEDNSGMSMVMNRMMHQFRFYIPASDTKLQGAAVERIKLTFPKAVVGNVTLDLANTSKRADLSEGSNYIDMQLTEPITLEAQNFACVAFCPTTFAAGESLQVKAYTADKIVLVDPIVLSEGKYNGEFMPGHSTPVKLKVKDVTGYPYSIRFKVAANNLGEKPDVITLTAPSGCVWVENGSNVYTYSTGNKIEVNEEFVFFFEENSAYQAFSEKSISVTYDSESAIVTQKVNIPNLSSISSTTVDLTVPYLFFEDFSGISDFSDGHDNPTVGGDSDTYKGISELTDNSLPGWYAARVGGKKGTSVRICCRYESVKVFGIGSSAYYKGRIYTSFLSNIKDGKNVKISVSFKYAGDRKERDPVFGSPPKKSPILYFGINYQNEVTNPDKIEGDGLLDGVAGLISGSGYASSKPTSLSPMVINGDTIQATGGSYTSFAGTKTVTIENVDNAMRLGWILSTDNTSSNTNANYWLYLDDIQVKIVK